MKRYLHNSLKILILSVGLMFCVAQNGWGQVTIFTESMGTVGGTTTIAAHETADGFDNDSYTMTLGSATNPGDIRVSSASSGYAGATGLANVWLTSTSGSYGFAIEGIDASAYTSLTVQFGYRKESASSLPTLALEYWNGGSWINVAFSFNEAAGATAGWYLSPVISLPVGAQINGLKIGLVKSGTVACRIDDIVLKGTLTCTPPSVPSGSITPAANPACTSTTLTYSAPNANIYWQTSSTGTSTANPTTSGYTVSTSGTYYVRAYNGSCWSTNSLSSAAITINPVPTISGTTTVWVGYTTTLTGSPAGGSWTSSNTSIATVDASGEVLGIAPGTSTITYTLSGCSANANVTVTSAPCLSTDFNSGSTPSGWLNNSVIFNPNGSCTSTNQAVYNAVGDYLVTSAINNPSSVNFTYRRSSNTTAWSLLVQIGSTSTGPWIDVQTISGATEACQTANIDLSAWSPFSGQYLKLIDTRGSGTNERYIDDLNVICSSSNTISTGTVSTSPFDVTCSTGVSGTVTFTSTGTFTSNTYTAQLSNSTGSFTSPTNIGTLISDANSGTINFTIPAGTISGSGYKIRVISSSPVVYGSHSATFTINLTGTCTAFEIESILVDACDGGTGLEGVNEMVRFQVGPSDLNTSDLNVTWPNPANPWRGICQNSGTASTVAAINATITGGGMLIEPTGGVLPANAQVMFFTSESFDYSLFDFSTLNYTIYAIFQCAGNTAGHFVNHSSTNPTNRTLSMTFTGHGTDAVTYNAYFVYYDVVSGNGDGGAVDFTPAGVPTYGTTGGCFAPIVPLPIELSGFSGKNIGRKVQLSWQTISETNNDYFEIQKSRDLSSFEKLGLVVGAGNTNSTITYSFTDEYPFNGNNYYKLKQFDFDGKSSESKIIVVNVSQNSLVNVYVSENNTLNIKSNNSSIGQIEILDVTGKQIYFLQNPSDNETLQINLPAISQGIYFVKIIGNNFTETRKIYFQ